MSNELYFHIGNGGVTVSVTNENGPTLNISANHFGHITNSMKLYMTRESLKELGDMLIRASEYNDFDEPYCYAVESENIRKKRFGNKRSNMASEEDTASEAL